MLRGAWVAKLDLSSGVDLGLTLGFDLKPHVGLHPGMEPGNGERGRGTMFVLSRDLLPGDRAEARISGRRLSSIFPPWPQGRSHQKVIQT